MKAEFNKLFKNAILNIIALVAKLGAKKTTHAALICPSAPPGSLGDAAMIIALSTQLRENGFKNIGVIEFNQGSKWTDAGDFNSSVAMPEFSVARWWRFAKELKSYDRLFVIGADCIDGYYTPALSQRLLEICSFATKAGCQGTVCGSSFNQSPAPNIVMAMRKLPSQMQVLARDPKSLARIQKICTAKCKQVADLAFLLSPAPSSIPTTTNWIENKRTTNKKIFGINIAAAILGPNEKHKTSQLVESFRNAINNHLAIDDNISIILIPHDIRGTNSDLSLCQTVLQGIESKHTDKILLFDEELAPQSLKAVAALLDACITCRMHFGIACLGSGTPIGAIPYQDKFEGLFELFKISPPMLDSSKALEPGEIERLIKDTLTQSDELRITIRSELNRIFALSKENFL